MVMEEVPNPQCVGREFVRQYYTMLNKAPVQMHRFYSKTSSFVHSGIDSPGKDVTPVFGQEHIHQAILKLCFNDCHAKIRRVDSHATLGNGVVVQVSGELSNNGQPMRRFMQTFVLAPLAPKNYYVHNDIFRYQDEVFSDDETGDEGVGSQAEHESETTKLTEPTTVIDEPVPTLNTTSSLGSNTWSSNTWPSTEMNGTVSAEETLTHRVETPPPPQSPTIPLEPIAPVDDRIQTPPPEPSPAYDDVSVNQQPDPIEKAYEPSLTDYSVNEIAHHLDMGSDGMSPPGGLKKSDEKKTYANILYNKGTDAGPPPVQPSRTDNFVSQSRRTRPPMQQRNTGGNTFRTERSRYNEPFRGQMGGEFMSMDSGPPPQRRNNYDEKAQLFVGNVPHNVDEDELMELFKKYGTIADLHMNTKTSARPGPGGRPAANFAFVTFDEAKAAQRVLDNRPIVLHDVSLNVEEKKSRKSSYGGERGGGRGGPMRGGPSMRPPRVNRFGTGPHQK